MYRPALGALAALGLALAVPAAGQTHREGCAVTARIVDYAVNERVRGAKAGQVKRQLAGGANGIEAKYEPLFGPLVDWVFTIEEGKLTGEVAKVFEETCLSIDN